MEDWKFVRGHIQDTLSSAIVENGLSSILLPAVNHMISIDKALLLGVSNTFDLVLVIL